MFRSRGACPHRIAAVGGSGSGAQRACGGHAGAGSAGAEPGGGAAQATCKRLPGHMGFVRVTVQNLTVVKVDTENTLIAVKGAVPGSKGTIVTLANSVKA